MPGLVANLLNSIGTIAIHVGSLVTKGVVLCACASAILVMMLLTLEDPVSFVIVELNREPQTMLKQRHVKS